MQVEERFFEDLAVSVDTWAETATDSFCNSNASLRWVDDPTPYRHIQQAIERGEVDPADVRAIMKEVLRGVATTFLTILDGGTTLAETARVYVVDESGTRLSEGLHEKFVGFLLDTGRLNA